LRNEFSATPLASLHECGARSEAAASGKGEGRLPLHGGPAKNRGRHFVVVGDVLPPYVIEPEPEELHRVYDVIVEAIETLL